MKLDSKDTAARAIQLVAGFETFGASVHAVRAALDEAPRGRFTYWDSVLLASAAGAGCRTIFSEDMADGAVHPITGTLPQSVIRAYLGRGEILFSSGRPNEKAVRPFQRLGRVDETSCKWD